MSYFLSVQGHSLPITLYFFFRDGAYFTVSKTPDLPEEFEATEHLWGSFSLWFRDDQNFTADEREEARLGFIKSQLYS